MGTGKFVTVYPGVWTKREKPYAEEYMAKIKELEDAKRQAKGEELSAGSILPYTNVRTLTRELVDLLIQNIYIYSSTSIEIVWKCGDEYQRLLADTTKKEAAEHEQG